MEVEDAAATAGVRFAVAGVEDLVSFDSDSRGRFREFSLMAQIDLVPK